MKLTGYSLGQVVSVGIMSVLFILALKFVGRRWNLPVVSQVAQAVSTLAAVAVRQHSASALDAVTAWVPGQLGRLSADLSLIPAGDLRDRAAASVQLVRDSLARARGLAAAMSCAEQSVRSDNLGPVPVTRCATSTPSKIQPRPGTTSAGSP